MNRKVYIDNAEFISKLIIRNLMEVNIKTHVRLKDAYLMLEYDVIQETEIV